MALCGDTCAVSVSSGNVASGHRFSIVSNAPEIDVRAFGSGDYGDFLACAKDGTVTVNCYMPIASLEAGDINVAVIAYIGATTLSCTNTTCTNVTCDVDSKGVVEWTYVFKLTGDITGW
jgi:Zn-finger protein